MAIAATAPTTGGFIAALNGKYHRASLNIFLVVVLAHWAEHLVQAYQIFVLGQARPKSRGVLGQFFPILVTSEWLHYGYAIVMIVGFFLLRRGFTGRAKTWWTIALAIQFWHHIEHFILLFQALTSQPWFGSKVPISFLQYVFPTSRVEIHLFYNAVVFIPMVIAMYLHLRPNEKELHAASCSCLQHRKRPATVGATA